MKRAKAAKSALIYGIIVAAAVFAVGFLPGMTPNTSVWVQGVFSLAVGAFGAILRFFIMEVLLRSKDK